MVEDNLIKLYIALISLIGVVIGAVITGILGFLVNKKLQEIKEKQGKKREVYEKFLISIQTIFFSGSLDLLGDVQEKNDAKKSYLENYEKIKLWGSIGVIKSISNFLAYNIEDTKELNEIHRKIQIIMEENLEIQKLLTQQGDINLDLSIIEKIIRNTDGNQKASEFKSLILDVQKKSNNDSRQNELKLSYCLIIEEMRNDLGDKNMKINKNDIQIVKF